jgi:protein-disulfide isomerase
MAGARTQAIPEATNVDGWQDALAAGVRLGSADAPIQVLEFADFQCPWCARFEATVQTIRDKYPDQVSFTFAHFPLPGHSFAEPAARVAECARNQGRFETMRSLLFAQQQAFGLVPWTDFAKQAEIQDIEEFEACVNDTRSLERVDYARELAEKMDIRGTPTVIVNGWKLPVTPSSGDFDKIVKNVLDGKPPATDIWN